MELFRNWNSIWLLHLCKEKNGNYIPIKKIKKIPYSRSQCVSLYLFAAFSLMFCKEQNPKLSSWFSRKGWEEHHISFLFLSIFHWNTFVHAKIFVSAFCHSLFVVRFFFLAILLALLAYENLCGFLLNIMQYVLAHS